MQINARKATDLRRRMLDALESRIEGAIVHVLDELTPEEQAIYTSTGKIPEEASTRIMSYLSADVNRLLTDSENRGYGNPTQPHDHGDRPRREITEDMSDAEAADAYRRELEGE